MFELRWLEITGLFGTDGEYVKKLQYRTQIEVTTPDGIELYWSEWTDVPVVKEV